MLVLRRLQEAGLTANPGKCKFFKSELTLIGLWLSSKGIVYFILHPSIDLKRCVVVNALIFNRIWMSSYGGTTTVSMTTVLSVMDF